jgi:hypothetical protein
VFHGVLPPTQSGRAGQDARRADAVLVGPDRMRDAPTTAPVESNRIRDAPPPADGIGAWKTVDQWRPSRR